MADAGPSPISALVQSPGATAAPGMPSPDQPAPQQGNAGRMTGLVRGDQPAAPPPPPTHEMTRAAMRHFGELKARLGKLLADPNVGKTNMRPQIFDMAASLLGDGFMTMPRLMNEIKTLPQDPADQKRWLQQHYDAVSKAQVAVLEHYRMGNPGSGDWRADLAALPPSKMEHAELMDGMMKHYQRR